MSSTRDDAFSEAMDMALIEFTIGPVTKGWFAALMLLMAILEEGEE
jgi:hypothetical protein